MDNQPTPSFVPPSAPVFTPVPRTPHASSGNSGAIATVVIAVLLIGGYLVWASSADSWPFAAEPMASESPIPTESPSVNPDPTADWKTYTNVPLGFELRYPESWELVSELISDVGTEINFHKQLQPPVGYSLTISTPPGTFDQYITAQSRELGTIQSQAPILFVGKPATKIHFVGGSGFTTDVIYIPRDSLNPLVITTGPSTYAETDQILSTFKFTTPSGFKVYRNTTYGFEVSVPSTWTTTETVSGVVFSDELMAETHNEVSVVANSQGKTIQSLEAEARANTSFANVLPAQVDGEPSVLWENTDGIPTQTLQVIHAGKIYTLTGSLLNGDVLSTFKFTP